MTCAVSINSERPSMCLLSSVSFKASRISTTSAIKTAFPASSSRAIACLKITWMTLQEVGAGGSPAAATSRASDMRWAAMHSNRKCSASNFTEEGLFRNPRCSNARQESTRPSFISRSAARIQRPSSRAKNLKARITAPLNALVDPAERQKSKYWYHSALSPLYLCNALLKTLWSNLMDSFALRIDFRIRRAFTRRRRSASVFTTNFMYCKKSGFSQLGEEILNSNLFLVRTMSYTSCSENIPLAFKSSSSGTIPSMVSCTFLADMAACPGQQGKK
mmetsp:Transcript_16383/g.36181  ORF Transcript_16383/g.36181 Transcript_16383/m.36181 type:complete len:276 (+) Transcript_16383:1087-1914(+)